MTRTRIAALAAFIVVACVVPSRTEAQSIANRVQNAPDGRVRFTFAAKPDVCGHGNSISRGNNFRYNWDSNGTADVEYDFDCSPNPVRVVLQVNDGNVTKLNTYVGGRWRAVSGSVTDLGAVSTRDAADYLMRLAATGTGSPSRDAIMAATLADSVVIWPSLSKIARDEERPSATRKQALFWLAQAAGDRVAGTEKEKETPETEIRKQAVFALSQRRNGEAVPALIQVARNNRDPEVRRSALFWLGQSNDSRVVDFFDELLRR
jgi:hypothetical protein